jgi:hypothetical protein
MGDDDYGFAVRTEIAKASKEAQDLVDKLKKTIDKKITGTERAARDKEKKFDPELAAKLSEKSKRRALETKEKNRQDYILEEKRKRERLRNETLSVYDDNIVEKLYEKCVIETGIAAENGLEESKTMVDHLIYRGGSFRDRIEQGRKWHHLCDHVCLRLYDRHNFNTKTDGYKIIVTLHQSPNLFELTQRVQALEERSTANDS